MQTIIDKVKAVLNNKFLFLLSTTLTLALLGCSNDIEEKETLRPVRYIEIKALNDTFSRSYPGVSNSGTQADLSFRVASNLTELTTRLGQIVKKGSVVAALDNSDATLSYDKEVANLKNTEVQLDTARSHLYRIKGLYEDDNVALNEYESAKNNHANAKAAFETQTRVVHLHQRQLGYYKLHAPIDGIISAINVDQNEEIQTGQVILTIQALGDIEINVGLPEQVIPLIKNDLAVDVTFSSFPNKIYKGKVSEFSYAANEETSTYPVTITLLTQDSSLRPGMSANVTFSLPNKAEKTTVLTPSHTVLEEAGQHFVFTVTPAAEDTGIIHKKKVVTGDMSSNGIQVTQGLTVGELAITAGLEQLSEGMKVKLLTPLK